MELQPLQFEKDLSYAEHPIKILDVQTKQLRNRTLTFLKIQWSRHSEQEATWELQSDMKKFFPYILEWEIVISFTCYMNKKKFGDQTCFKLYVM